MQAENLGRKAKSCSPVVRQGEQKLYRLPTICRYSCGQKTATLPYRMPEGAKAINRLTRLCQLRLHPS